MQSRMQNIEDHQVALNLAQEQVKAEEEEKEKLKSEVVNLISGYSQKWVAMLTPKYCSKGSIAYADIHYQCLMQDSKDMSNLGIKYCAHYGPCYAYVNSPYAFSMTISLSWHTVLEKEEVTSMLFALSLFAFSSFQNLAQNSSFIGSALGGVDYFKSLYLCFVLLMPWWNRNQRSIANISWAPTWL